MAFNDNKLYCLYFHINPKTLKVFYVGIGTGRRPFETKGRSSLWERTFRKYGHIVDIIYENLSLEKAKELEIFYIGHFGRRDLMMGNLVNHTNGGDGINGYKHSEETKNKIKLIQQNRSLKEKQQIVNKIQAKRKNTIIKIWSKGLTKETDKRIAYIASLKRNKPLQLEHKGKLSEAKKQKVYQFDIKGGFIREFESHRKVFEFLGYKKPNRCLKNAIMKQRIFNNSIWKEKNNVQR